MTVEITRHPLRSWFIAAGPPVVVAIVGQSLFCLAVVSAMGELTPWRAAVTVTLFGLDAVGRRTANDYIDAKSGLDTPDNVRSDNPMALGLPMRRIKHLAVACFVGAGALAAFLCVTSRPWLLVPTALCYLAFMNYTSGMRLGYRGMGEAIDFLVTGFGVSALAVMVNAQSVTPAGLAACLAPACLFTMLMVHQNARDVRKDLALGKRTLPAVIGLNGTKAVYCAALGISFLVLLPLAWRNAWMLAPLCSLLLILPGLPGFLRSNDWKDLPDWKMTYVFMIGFFYASAFACLLLRVLEV